MPERNSYVALGGPGGGVSVLLAVVCADAGLAVLYEFELKSLRCLSTSVRKMDRKLRDTAVASARRRMVGLDH